MNNLDNCFVAGYFNQFYGFLCRHLCKFPSCRQFTINRSSNGFQLITNFNSTEAVDCRETTLGEYVDKT